MTRIETECCIAGGGPAGMMLGLLLARAGIAVTVLEKHKDFNRDFRGDTIHPSTLELMYELGMLDRFLELPHQKLVRAGVNMNGRRFTVVDLSRLDARCKYIAFMPQWDFLNFIQSQAEKYEGFSLNMRTVAEDLIIENDRVIGVTARRDGERLQVRAGLVVAADGRGSTLRERAGLTVEDLGAPMDVLWIRIPKSGVSVAENNLANLGPGRIVILIDRDEYWQCAVIIRKGFFDEIKARGIQRLKLSIQELVPETETGLRRVVDWDQVFKLTVKVDRLQTWCRHGLLCIGDSAHAMSPVGGVGINLAIQDAVAAANRLCRPLGSGCVTLGDLEAVQKRREFPTKVTQRFQLGFQNQVISRVLSDSARFDAPWPLRLLDQMPVLRRIPTRFIGIGVRPERIKTPEATRAGNPKPRI